MSELLDDTGKPSCGTEPEPTGSQAAEARARPGRRCAALLRWARSHAHALAGLPLATVALFALYLHQALTQPLNADGSSNALQAWDMLHGNLLLDHWSVTDVSFYLTELPEYMLVEALHGLDAEVVAISAAITYTLLVLLACLLARGRATGREAFIRVLIVVVVMIAPTAGPGTIVVLSSPDHLGTAVALLLVYLAYERVPRGRYRPLLLFLLLAWAGISDSTALLVGSGGIAVLNALRLWQGRGTRREVAELGAAVLAVAAGVEVPRLIHQLGGFLMRPPAVAFTAADQMATSFWEAIGSYLQLFAADFFGMPLLGPDQAAGPGRNTGETVIVLLHLVGAALVTAALAKTALSLRRGADPAGTEDRIVKFATIGLLLNLAAYAFSTQISGGAREIAVVLPLGAVVAGRVFGPRVAAQVSRERRRRPVVALGALAVVLFGALVFHAGQRAAPPDASGAEVWLKQHGYVYGLGGYWNANNITVASGGVVQVRPVNTGVRGIVQYTWDSKSTWYDPAEHYADFIVFGLGAGSSVYARPEQAVAQFGPPVRTVPLPGEEIMIWNKNLLTELPPG